MSKLQQHFYGFDYARAIFCIAIVGWHFRLIGSVSKVNNYQGFQYKDIVNFHFFLLAVPFFVQLSLYLYAHSRFAKQNYLKKRLLHLANLFTFWVSFGVIIHYLRGDNISSYFETPMSFLTMIYHGGYDLYYFIFIIIVTTIITEIIYKLRDYLPAKHTNNVLLALFATSLVPIILAPFFDWNFRNPINFIPLVFSSILLSENKNLLSNKATYIYGILYIGLSISDWFLIPYYNIFAREGLIMPDYSRISLIFGSIFLLSLFMKINRKPNNIVQLLSSYSFGIYCLHVTVPHIIIFLAKKIHCDQFIALLTIDPNTINIPPFLFSLFTTIITIYFMKKLSWISKYV